MEKKSTLKNESLDKLILDRANPRFAELYNGSNDEDDLIEYLLYTESGEDIAKGILQVNEFYPDRPLWVLKDGDNYLVKDGNRRCAAVKALQSPEKYGLNVPKLSLNELPILIYKNKEDLEKRIIQEHTANLFREWDRIAKALEVYKLYSSGNSIDSMKEIDSSPSELIKLASFYYEAVKIKGEELKKLLRRGKGKTGGKTIIFERLFKYGDLCGYKFKNKPFFKIDILDQEKFSEYISSLVAYLKKYPDTTHKIIDEEKEEFLEKLRIFGFNFSKKSENMEVVKSKKSQLESSQTEEPNSLEGKKKRKSVKNKPCYERKGIPASLERLIRECYNLDPDNFSNAKTALTRVSFECTLKYVVENTKYDSKKNISDSAFFSGAFFSKGDGKRYTNFTALKDKFTELIINTGKRKAFENFDLEIPHQIIHNYNVGASPANATALCENLIVLLEFLLQDEVDLLKSLNASKL